MNTRIKLLFGALALGLTTNALAQGTTAFTYQGRLADGTNAANGLYDLNFSLFAVSTGGSQLGLSDTFTGYPVSNGLFTVALDFGAAPFNGDTRWLEIAVRSNGLAGNFTPLAPRQPITPAPYAITARNLSGGLSAAGLVGSYTNAVVLNNPANFFSGSYAGNGGALSNINAATVGGFVPSALWQTRGNAGTLTGTNFLGTVDNQSLELKVNSLTALRLEPALKSPNIVGGYEGNSVAPGVSGGVIAGGGTRRDSPGDNGGPEANVVMANYGFIGAGYGNELGGSASVIVGGTWNSLGDGGWESFIGSGNGNRAESPWSAIPGGGGNFIGTLSGGGFIGSGFNNQIGNGVDCAVVGGGSGNLVDNSPYSVIAGGRFNKLWGESSDVTICGGQSNLVREHAYAATIAGGHANTVGGGSSHATIGGGSNNTCSASATTVAGGRSNLSGSEGATVGGGASNSNRTYYGTIGGGEANALAYAAHGTISGGGYNKIADFATGATISGGGGNVIQGSVLFGVVAGGSDNSIGADAYLSTIGGGWLNTIAVQAGLCTIAGGFGNRVMSNTVESAIGGGCGNTIEANLANATIAGGISNTTAGTFSTVGGGGYNCARGFAATVGGGGGFVSEPDGNSAMGDWSTVSGGRANSASGEFAVVAGGEGNHAQDRYAVVPGGLGNNAQGQCSFAAGENASAEHDGTFVWADASFTQVLRSTATNQFTARASGGFRFFTDTQATSGAELAPGSGSWSSLSDRAAKEEVRPVNGRAMLEKLVCLPMNTWRYKTQAPEVRHLGPMAQDFHAAFGLGEDERHIATVDADGVALAAIQGLNQKLNEKDAEIQDLKHSVTELKQLVQTLAAKR